MIFIFALLTLKWLGALFALIWLQALFYWSTNSRVCSCCSRGAFSILFFFFLLNCVIGTIPYRIAFLPPFVAQYCYNITAASSSINHSIIGGIAQVSGDSFHWTRPLPPPRCPGVVCVAAWSVSTGPDRLAAGSEVQQTVSSWVLLSYDKRIAVLV